MKHGFRAHRMKTCDGYSWLDEQHIIIRTGEVHWWIGYLSSVAGNGPAKWLDYERPCASITRIKHGPFELQTRAQMNGSPLATLRFRQAQHALAGALEQLPVLDAAKRLGAGQG